MNTKTNVYELVENLLSNNKKSLGDVSSIKITKNVWDGEELIPEFEFKLRTHDMFGRTKYSEEDLKKMTIEHKNTPKEDFSVCIDVEDYKYLVYEPTTHIAINREFWMDMLEYVDFQGGNYPENDEVMDLVIEFRQKKITSYSLEEFVYFDYEQIQPEYIETVEFNKLHLKITMEYNGEKYTYDKVKKMWVDKDVIR